MNANFSDLFKNTLNWCMENASPLATSFAVTKEMEQGPRLPVVTFNYCLDLTQPFLCTTTADFLSSLWMLKTVHVINDRTLIKECLNRENRKNLVHYRTAVNLVLQDSHNMLLCPPEEHGRLRRPYEPYFSQSYLQQPDVATQFELSAEEPYPPSNWLEQTKNAGKRAVEDGKMHETERLSTVRLLEAASNFTVSKTIEFIERLIQQYPSYAQAIEHNEHKLRAFVFESMRLFPVVPHIARVATNSFALSNGQKVYSGEILILNILGYQRSPEMGGSEFNPHNFLQADGTFSEDKKMKLLNFGAGDQTCIGRNVAERRLLLTTQKILKKSSFKPKIEVDYLQKGLFLEPTVRFVSDPEKKVVYLEDERSIEILPSYANAHRIKIAYCANLRDFSILQQSPLLKVLDLNACDVEELPSCPSVEVLDITSCQKLKALPFLTSACKVYITHCKALTDISSLANSPRLETLYLDGCPIKEFPKCPNLQSLRIWNTLHSKPSAKELLGMYPALMFASKDGETLTMQEPPTTTTS